MTNATTLVRLARTLAVALAVAAGLALAAPARDLAAQSRVYALAELTTPPKVRSPSAATTAVENSLPAALRSIGGRVQLEFVVSEDGRVEPESIQVVVSSASALGDAAKRAVQRISFTPGTVDGQPVRARVQFPIVYTAR
jgi:TonB family protein